MGLPLTLPYVILTLKEFLIVWINQVLYYNAIYPLEIYDKVKSFDTIVYQSRNPVLNKYIENLVNEFLQIVLKGDGHENGGKVNQILISLYDMKSNRTQKKYGLKFNEMINLGSSINDMSFLYEDENDDPDSLLHPVIDIPSFSWDEIYSQLKSILFSQIEELKINQLNNNATENDDLFFKIIVDLEDSLNLDINTNANTNSVRSNWVKLNQPTGRQDERIKTKFIPIGEVSVGFICIDVYNEYLRKMNT